MLCWDGGFAPLPACSRDGPNTSSSISWVSDAVAVEAATGEAAEAYVNVLAVKEGSESSAGIQALVKALQSDTVKTFIEDTYDGAVVPLF